jgi:hypothetical protein
MTASSALPCAALRICDNPRDPLTMNHAHKDTNGIAAHWGWRVTHGLLLLTVVAGTAALWWFFAPGNGPGGPHLRLACYIACGGLLAITAMAPYAGLLMLAFSAPLLSAVPLYLTDGSTYPLVLFAALGFGAGWLARETVQPHVAAPFPGQRWLWLLAVLAAYSALATWLRYLPPWMWSMPDFLRQIINTKDMTRLDAVRFLGFDMANGAVAILIISAVQAIVRLRAAPRAGVLVIWALLLGCVCAAGMALYQAQSPAHITLCANKSYYWTRLQRVNGTCADPNALGTLLALAVTLAGLRVLFSGSLRSVAAWFEHVLALGALILFFMAIRYAGSRSGLLASVLACACAVLLAVIWYGDALLRARRAAGYMRVAYVALVLLVCVGAWQQLPRIIDTLDGKIQMGTGTRALDRRLKRDFRLFHQQRRLFDMMNDQMRLIYWRFAKKLAGTYPWSVVGFGAYVIELPNEAALTGDRLYRTDNACNYYLHYAAELGGPGILALGLFYGTLLLWFPASLRRWWALPLEAQCYRMTLMVCLAVFMIVLIFGVHTLADEVNVAFAILLGLIGADHARVMPRTPLPLVWRWAVRLALVLLLAVFVWQTNAVNRGALNTQRRLAVCGLASETGWHAWETVPGQPSRARWMGAQALSVIPRENLLLGIPVLSPPVASATKPVRVRCYINGLLLREHTFTAPGEWALLTVPVPYADAFAHVFAPHTAVRIEVDRTWVPRAATGANDVRRLGVMVGQLRWLEPTGMDNGWYQRERWEGVTPFRWSSGYAWQKCALPTNTHMQIPMYASNIQLRRWPLQVAIYLNRQYLDTITLRDKRWKSYTYPLPDGLRPGTTALVEVISARTWVPKHYGFADPRALGVGVGDISFE